MRLYKVTFTNGLVFPMYTAQPEQIAKAATTLLDGDAIQVQALDVDDNEGKRLLENTVKRVTDYITK